MESGIPYGTAFIKNSYVGRTFIKPKQSARESSVMVKLNVLREIVRGKRVVMVDDSIVRGTYGKTLDEIRDSIEADTLAYLGMERLKELNNGLPYCDACFSGNYPIEPPTQDIRGEQG